MVHFAHRLSRSIALSAWRLAWVAAVFVAPSARAADLAADPPQDAAAFSIATFAPTPDQSSLGGRASLEFQVPSLQTSLQAAVERGGADAAPDALAAASWGPSWTGSHTALSTIWTPADDTRLQLDLSDQFKQTLSLLDPLAPGLPVQLTNTRTQTAKLTAVLTPVSAIELQLGAQADSGVVETPAYPSAGAVVAASDLRSDTGRAFAQVSWKPVSRLSLEAGSAIESLGVAVQGAAGGAAAYAYMTPHLAATFTPWTDAALAFSAERKVSAPNAAQFASFIQTADHPGADAFQPDHEWRYSASFKQALGPEAAMSASFTQSNLQSVTDLGPVGAGQAPVDIGPGERRQVNLAVVAPLLLPGLSAPAKLSASADWLASDVTDPFTGQRRPISGDAAYDAELNLSGVLHAAPLIWALKAQFSGRQLVYQMSQVDMASPTAGLGGSINYRAGPVTLCLQLDNIVGGARTDTSVMFDGSRAADMQDGVRQTHEDSRAVRISFVRAL